MGTPTLQPSPLPLQVWSAVLGYSLLSFVLFAFLWEQTDTASYVNAVYLLSGDTTVPDDRLFRLSKPLALILPTLLYQWTGLLPHWGLLLQQYLAYWIGAWALYQWLFALFSDRQLASYGLLAYLGMQPLAVYGLAMLTDGAGWAALLFGLYAAQAVLWSRTWSWKPILCLGMYWGGACFIKESVVVAGLWAAGLVWWQVDWAWRQKWSAYGLLSIGFISVLIVGNCCTAWLWERSLWSWVQFGRTAPPPFSWQGFLAQAYHTLDSFWWLVVLGIGQSWQHHRQARWYWVSLTTAGLGWLLFPWIWFYSYDRILFMLVPLLLPLLALGARALGRGAIPLLLLGGLTHLLSTFLIYRYQISGLLIPFGLSYGLLCFGLYWRFNKSS